MKSWVRNGKEAGCIVWGDEVTSLLRGINGAHSLHCRDLTPLTNRIANIRADRATRHEIYYNDFKYSLNALKHGS